MLRYLWAQDKNGVIGYKNDLPWHLPADLRYFKAQTVGKTIVMGRKTYQSIGRPLPQRVNIVLTTDPTFQAEGVRVMHSKQAVLDYAATADEAVVITGGSAIFELFRDEADELLMTFIDESFEGDTYMPAFAWDKYELVKCVPGVVDEKNRYDHEYRTYRAR